LPPSLCLSQFTYRTAHAADDKSARGVLGPLLRSQLWSLESMEHREHCSTVQGLGVGFGGVTGCWFGGTSPTSEVIELLGFSSVNVVFSVCGAGRQTLSRRGVCQGVLSVPAEA
jgi:hypothetical protein